VRWPQATDDFLATGDARCHDGEHIRETGSGNPIVMVFKLFNAIATYILLSVTEVHIVFSNILCVTLLNQKFYATSSKIK